VIASFEAQESQTGIYNDGCRRDHHVECSIILCLRYHLKPWTNILNPPRKKASRLRYPRNVPASDPQADARRASRRGTYHTQAPPTSQPPHTQLVRQAVHSAQSGRPNRPSPPRPPHKNRRRLPLPHRQHGAARPDGDHPALHSLTRGRRHRRRRWPTRSTARARRRTWV
jgi:hypothetical protein